MWNGGREEQAPPLRCVPRPPGEVSPIGDGEGVTNEVMQESTTPHPPQAVPLSRLRARSRCGSDSHSGCHSTPHRRFATQRARHATVGEGFAPPAHHSTHRNAYTDNPSVLLRNPPPFAQGRLTSPPTIPHNAIRDTTSVLTLKKQPE